MTNINVSFCRALLVTQRESLTPEQRVRCDKGWTYGFQRGAGDWEFQIPGEGFYWHGHADNAYDARYQGICEWLARAERQATPDPYRLNGPLGQRTGF